MATESTVFDKEALAPRLNDFHPLISGHQQRCADWFTGAGLGLFICLDHASQQGIEMSWPMLGDVNFALPLGAWLQLISIVPPKQPLILFYGIQKSSCRKQKMLDVNMQSLPQNITAVGQFGHLNLAIEIFRHPYFMPPDAIFCANTLMPPVRLVSR